jgi:hypothetical protein
MNESINNPRPEFQLIFRQQMETYFLKKLLTQKMHSAPITQQAEKLASHAQRTDDVPVNFS